MNMRKPIIRKSQDGAVLITTLMILVLLTIFGVSTMDTNILEEKMAGNMRERNVAFQSAEAALRACEGYLATLSTLPYPSNDGNTSIWDYKKADPDTSNNIPWWDEWNTANWSVRSVNNPANAVIGLGDTVNGTVVGTPIASALGLSAEPLCVLEKLPPIAESIEVGKPVENERIYLQITAQGLSASGKGVVLLQSVYKW